MHKEKMKINKDYIIKEIEDLGVSILKKRNEFNSSCLDFLITNIGFNKDQAVDITSNYFLKKKDNYDDIENYISYFSKKLEENVNEEHIMVNRKIYLNYIKEKSRMSL